MAEPSIVVRLSSSEDVEEVVSVSEPETMVVTMAFPLESVVVTTETPAVEVDSSSAELLGLTTPLEAVALSLILYNHESALLDFPPWLTEISQRISHVDGGVGDLGERSRCGISIQIEVVVIFHKSPCVLAFSLNTERSVIRRNMDFKNTVARSLVLVGDDCWVSTDRSSGLEEESSKLFGNHCGIGTVNDVI
ncbi:hypothetical protein OGAPHI_003477 [Ogataea philodendri]|uniref:Uncharacterized protein n=1 Tax=Ogataea philodendri TaxID=1378263 RepID=A0A9P8T567_9ASCO|nr:uncharacterized protein OGAPHI_003477 [Ogataea philodendri]KAH3666481.1 hypothetical protein OGAPHI_003477 [Ogataea philodendri]